MLKLIIEDDEGRKTVVPFVREEITIGRQEGNTIRLTERNVSRRHARLMRQNGHVLVEDLGSYNGTRINGERISGQSSVRDGDLIQIGDYDLALQSDTAASRARPPPVDDEPSDPDAGEPETETETPVADEPSGVSAEQRRHSTSIIRMGDVESNRPRKVKDLDPEEAPRLVVVSAELKGQEFACIRTELRIGRTDDNDIVIDHRSLSRTHAKLVCEDNGEWRIIDMQSANGLTVNGESYAQASLSGGDLVELGHVKLRFVLAGDEAAPLDADRRSKLPLVLALVLLVVGAGGAAAFLLKPESVQPDPQPAPPELSQTDPQQAQPPNPPPQEPPVEPQPPPTEPPPPEQPDPAALAEAAKALEARLQSARKALAEGKLDKAEDDLLPARNPDGTWPEQVQPVVDEIAAEKQARTALTDARKALEDKKLDEAEQLLASAASSQVFAKEREKLRGDLEDARKALAKANTPPRTPSPPPRAPMEPSDQERAETSYKDAFKLFRAKQYENAIILATECTNLDPKNPDCHMLLGASYASASKFDKAADAYRRFLDLVPPDSERAKKVRSLLENYEKAKDSGAPK